MKYKIEKNTVQETLILPLYSRKLCTELYPNLYRDETAVRLIDQIDYDFSEAEKNSRSLMQRFGALEVAMRQNDLAFEVQAYLKNHPCAAVVNLGCGLDNTGRACDNGRCKIYNLDFPDVIALRQQLLPAGEREQNIPCDLKDPAWFDKIEASGGAVFFASGVFYYFLTEQVRELVQGMADAFPGGVLVFDAANRTAVKMIAKTWLRTAKIKDVGAYFAVSDAKSELSPWDSRLQVSSWGYMLGYNDLKDPSVSGFFRFLAKFGDNGMKMQIVKIGFGCTVPAVMATRTLPSERDRKMTILLTPFMSCTAKLPIYAFFVSAFFPGHGGLIMTGLYILGILVGILAAVLFKSTLFKGEAVPFVMELPNYRLPGVKNVSQLLWEKAKDFLQRAFTVILVATVAVWFLQSFDFQFNLVEDSSGSILAVISGWLAPLFAPLGLGDWRIITSLVSGFMAKESVVSTLEVLFAGGVETALTTLAAASLLVFCLLYTPCVAAIAAVKRELGGKWAVLVVLWQCGIAWIAAMIVKIIGNLMGVM